MGSMHTWRHPMKIGCSAFGSGDGWRFHADERQCSCLSLACVAPASTCVVQATAFPEHAAVVFGCRLFRGAALMSDLAGGFLLGGGLGFAGSIALASVGLRKAGGCKQT